MRKINKIIALIMLILVIISITTISYGFGIDDLTGTPTETVTLKKAGNSIVTVLTTIGVVLSVVILIILGIKYMIGSVEEKATYKKSLMPYVIGSVLVFGASTIAQIIYELANQM